MAKVLLPDWIPEALKPLAPSELKKLARDAKISERHLRRIKNRDIDYIRTDTLERLQRHLTPLYLQGAAEITLQIKQDQDIRRLYHHLLDAPRTGLQIHKLLVDKGWAPWQLAKAMIAVTGYEGMYFFEVPQHSGSGGFISHLAQLFAAASRDPDSRKAIKEELLRLKEELQREEARREEVRPKGISESLTEHVELILFGGFSTVFELAWIACALGEPLGEIFQANPEGVKIFKKFLSETKDRDPKANRLLDDMRRLLGLIKFY
jgi:AraC-like DNA-binding protein